MRGVPLLDPEKTKLPIGHRFKLSALGAERCPRLAAKIGTVVGRLPNSAIVKDCFDGNRTATSIHRDCIEPIDQ
jgi:hypothetical protein